MTSPVALVMDVVLVLRLEGASARSDMGEVINLRRARKARARDSAEREAAANRATFGRTRAEKEQARAEETRQAARLDEHRREPPTE
jgi:hypothetical protein